MFKIFNHQIYLDANSEPLLQVKQDKKGAYVDKIRHVQIESKEDAYRVLEAGRKNLSVGQTRLNKGDNLYNASKTEATTYLLNEIYFKTRRAPTVFLQYGSANALALRLGKFRR